REIHLDHRPVRRVDPRVVDQEVQPAERLDRLRDRLVLVVGVVGRTGREHGVVRAELGHRGLEGLGLARRDDDLGAVVDETLRDTETDAARRARDDRELAVEAACSHERRSRTMAMPMPPPTHMDSTPNCLSCHCSELISVDVMRAPVMPNGWPTAIAPPLT